MKNKIFKFIISSTTFFFVILFLFLIICLVTELTKSDAMRKINFSEIIFAVKLSLMTATISSFLSLFFAIPISYYLSRYDFKFKDLVNTLLDLPLVLSPIALGAMILIFFNTTIGRYIEQNITQIIFEVKGIILAQFFVIIGLGIRQIKIIFDNINTEYEDISRTLGADKLKTFFYVILPMSKKIYFPLFYYCGQEQ